MDELRIDYVPLAELKKWPANPKDHDLGVIHQSLDEFGFRDPLAVNRRNNEIEEGHGRVDALEQKKQKGDPPPARIRIGEDGDWLVPIMFFDDDEKTQVRYALVHNKSVELGGYDEAKLFEVLSDLQVDGDLAGSGFDDDDIDRLKKDLEGAAGGALDPEDTGITYQEQFGVIVLCTDESHQEEVFNKLMSDGYTCRVVTV